VYPSTDRYNSVLAAESGGPSLLKEVRYVRPPSKTPLSSRDCVDLPTAGSATNEDANRAFRAVDLNVGDSQEVELADGSRAHVKFLDLKENARQGLRQAVQGAPKSRVRGERLQSVARFPAITGCRFSWAACKFDCPITRGYRSNNSMSFLGQKTHGGLEKEARLRLWPAGLAADEPRAYFVIRPGKRWFRQQHANGQYW